MVQAVRHRKQNITHYLLWKQRIVLCTLCVLAVAALFGARQHALPASSTGRPLSGMTILVDAGHGGYDGGACGSSGTWEKEINLQVALHTRAQLTALGATVVMTRTDDSDLCSEGRPADKTKKRQDMEARIALAREHQVDMVLSIHMNYYRDRRQSGPQVFYRKGSDSSRLLAGCMQEQLIESLAPPKQRSAMAGDYFILQLDVPSVLIECGFLSNAAEEALLLSNAYQHQLAGAIAKGVTVYASLPR